MQLASVQAGPGQAVCGRDRQTMQWYFQTRFSVQSWSAAPRLQLMQVKASQMQAEALDVAQPSQLQQNPSKKLAKILQITPPPGAQPPGS